MTRSAKHSYVRFYPSDWKGGVSDMPRLVQSVYFQICLYTWDSNKPVPKAQMMLMLADLGQQGVDIIDALVDSEKLVRNSDGSIHNRRALAESTYAFDQWEKRSFGGKGGKKAAAEGKTLQTLKASDNQEPRTKNLEEERDVESDDSTFVVSPKKSDVEIVEVEIPAEEAGDGEEESAAKPERKRYNLAGVVEAWNTMAVANKLTQILKMTDDRQTKLRRRIDEHGDEAIIAAIAKIPESSFLMGKRGTWKANFDWLLQPKSCAKLIEGAFQNEGDGEGSAWR